MVRCFRGNTSTWLLGLAVMAGSAGFARADAISTAIDNASTGLVNAQSGGGMWTGNPTIGYNGTIIAGLVNSYNNTGNATYKTAAQNGATADISYVNANYQGKYLGDEVYALAQVASLQANPSVNSYQTAASNFFNSTIPSNYINISGYVNWQANAYGEHKDLATIYLSYLTVAAYKIGEPTAVQNTLRNGLIATLGQVADITSDGSDYQYYSTSALGAAVWALAQTGPLDSTPITGPTTGQNVFGGHVLSDLPGMLDARLEPTSKTFYEFLTNDTWGYAYTEDTAYGIMGLDAVDVATATSTYASDVAAARLALTGAVDSGTDATYDNILNPTPAYTNPVNAGWALQALAVPEPTSLVLLAMGGIALLTRRRIIKARGVAL